MKAGSDPRRFLLDLYAAALASVEGRSLVRRFLASRPAESYRVLAIGKAAAAMALGAFDVIPAPGEALVITKHGYGTSFPSWITLIEAGHPTPDAESLRAGEALLRFISHTPPDQPLLFLLSGGASALVEVLPDGVTLDDLARANQWMLGAGLDIVAINRIRKRISRIKQGRLARFLDGRRALCLLISDVPGDEPWVIGSGPLVADPDVNEPLPQMPARLASLVTCSSPPPAPGDVCFARIETHVLASNRAARTAAAESAQRSRIAVLMHDSLLSGDVVHVSEEVSQAVLSGPPGLYIWGGEPTVRLPHAPGRGGRCQHLALLLARKIAHRDDLFVLAAGTDGSDGPGDDAGALVDGGTLDRGMGEGLDVEAALSHADSGSFLEASGDLITTGPTGTNVMDLIIALKTESSNSE